MKIAFLNAYGNGSTGRIVNKLKEVCEKDGHQVLSIYARESCVRNDKTTIKCINKIDFYIDGLLTHIFDNHGLNSKFNTQKILSKLNDFAPDIIHIHNLHGYWINYPMLFDFLKKRNQKVVWTFHDCWHFTGHCTHFDFIGCDRWKTECHNCPQLKEYPSSLGFDGSRRNFRLKKKYFTSLKELTIITPSKWLKSKVDQSFLNIYNVRVINNGVDISVFKPSLNASKRDKILKEGYKGVILGCASSWNERKGLKDIIQVAKEMPQLYFVIIGSVPEQSQKNRVTNNVLFIEHTENVATLCEWYSTADILVNPTLEDTYPTTNLEAIACGTPVVTYSTGGSEEIVAESEYGEVTVARNSKSLKDSIINQLHKRNLIISSNFVLDDRIKYSEYLDLYKSLEDGIL